MEQRCPSDTKVVVFFIYTYLCMYVCIMVFILLFSYKSPFGRLSGKFLLFAEVNVSANKDFETRDFVPRYENKIQ